MQTIFFIIFWDFLTFYQIFVSQNVKRCAIITYKHSIYELSYKQSNYLRLRILENQEVWRKCVNFIESQRSAQSSCQRKNLLIPAKNLCKTEIKLFLVVRYFPWKPRVSLRYFANGWLFFSGPKLLKTPSNVLFFTILITLRRFTQL